MRSSRVRPRRQHYHPIDETTRLVNGVAESDYCEDEESTFDHRPLLAEISKLLSKERSQRSLQSVETASTAIFAESWESSKSSPRAAQRSIVGMNQPLTNTAASITTQSIVSSNISSCPSQNQNSAYAPRTDTRFLKSPAQPPIPRAQLLYPPSKLSEAERHALARPRSRQHHTGPVDVDEVKPIVDLDSDDEEGVHAERRDGPVDVDEYLDLPLDNKDEDEDDDRFILYEDDFIVRGEEDYEKIMMGYCEGFEPEVIDLSPGPMSSSSSSSLLLSYQKRRKFSAEVIPQPIAEQVSRPSRGKKMSKPLNEEDEDTDDDDEEEGDDDAWTESFCTNCKGRDCRGGKFCI